MRTLVGFARSIVKGDANFDHEPRMNGERFVVEQIGKAHAHPVLLDVGANGGEWTAMALAAAPSALVHAFEIVPETFARLQAALGNEGRARLNAFGLSDVTGRTKVRVATDDTRSSLVENFDYDMPTLRFTEAETMRGDEYLAKAKIEDVHLLKIDVEGGEPKVLAGFSGALGERKVRAIQFEYGLAAIWTKFLLKDFYELLEPLGFTVGKIYPNHVTFGPYSPRAEDFAGPNYLAVRRSEEALIRALRG